MLNDHDHSLISREQAIPGFRYLLQPREIRRLLCRQGAVSDPGELRIGYLRYKPGMNCIARYEFRLGGEQRFAYAKAFSKDALKKLEKARAKANGASPLGPGTVVLEDQRILFSVFPHDSRLRSVGRLADHESRASLLTRLFKTLPGWDAGVFRTLNYKPERRLVARFTNPGGDCATVKFYSRAEFNHVREFRKHLRRVPRVRFPDWIGGSKAHHALAFSWMPGTILRDLPPSERIEAIRKAGAMIARFHLSPQPRFRPQDPALAATRTKALADHLAVLLPEEASHAFDLARALTGWQETLSSPRVPVHGDFYDKQVVVDDHGVAFIDSDNAHAGHPAADIGCFIAHLERNALNPETPDGNVAEFSEALLDGYRDVNPGQDFSRLGLHTAYALFQLIHNPFRDRARDWPGQTRALLNRATRLFEDG
jgi:aminoglycoside phosphotransferase (APT) family kinase protein